MAEMELNSEEMELIKSQDIDPDDVRNTIRQIDQVIDDFMNTVAYERAMGNEPGAQAALDSFARNLEVISQANSHFTPEQTVFLDKFLDEKFSKDYFTSLGEKMADYVTKDEIDEIIDTPTDERSSLRDELIFLDRATFDDSHGLSDKELLERYERALSMYNATREAIETKVPEGLRNYVISATERELGIAGKHVFTDAGMLFLQLRGQEIESLVNVADELEKYRDMDAIFMKLGDTNTDPALLNGLILVTSELDENASNKEIARALDIARISLYDQALTGLNENTYEDILGSNRKYLEHFAKVDLQYLENKIEGISTTLKPLIEAEVEQEKNDFLSEDDLKDKIQNDIDSGGINVTHPADSEPSAVARPSDPRPSQSNAL